MLSPIEILLVEDNPRDGSLTRKLLEDALKLVNITHCETLAAALGRLQSTQFACILLSVQLPDASGTAMIPTLRMCTSDTPIVVMIGRHDRALALQAIRAGAQDYLVKDETSPSALGRIICCAIERAQYDLELRRTKEQQYQIQHALYETLLALTSSLEVDEVLNRLLINIDRIVPHDAANIVLLEGSVARVVRSRNATADIRATGEMFRIQDVPEIEEVVRSGSATTRVVGTVPCAPQTSERLGYLGVPIRLQGSVVGLLNLFRSDSTPFQPEDMRRLTLFAEQAAIALQNARAHGAAQQSAAPQQE